MNKTKAFIGLTIMGGLAVMLPVVLLLLIIQWLYGFTSGLLEPITSLLSDKAEINQLLAMLLVTAIFLFLCFLIGLTVRTAIGSWLHDRVDHALVRVAPGYKTIREVVSQLLGGNGDTSLLKGTPALARIFGAGSPVTVTAIITSRHTDGGYTVFVPTAPIPTSGVIYHLPADCVEILKGVSVEEAMRTVISCGTGSAELLQRRFQKK
ncbi:MAG: DUF502 domain-containing protein [Porticoccaceae bacterium]|nr:DUF502 domain-containing protein [Pseudomonadales bacterium]MCP5171837.1 DUF502 domain-containing protein [Pseudomonadales bacterium]